MLSVTAWCLIGVPVQQWARYLKMIHNSGYEGIELHVDLQPWPISIKTKKDELLWLIDAVNIAGLKVTGLSTMLHMDYPITSKDRTSKTMALEVVDKMFDIAKLMGGKHVSIAPGGIEANWQDAINIIKAINDKARNDGILLMLENVWYSFSRDIIKLEHLMDALEDTNIGVCLDIGNAFPFGNIEEWLLRFEGKIKKIHISDSRIGDPPQICPIGQGHVDWKNVGRIVKNMHYDGDITLELFPRRGMSLSLELMRISRFIKKQFDIREDII